MRQYGNNTWTVEMENMLLAWHGMGLSAKAIADNFNRDGRFRLVALMTRSAILGKLYRLRNKEAA